jgi:hypothetical protein
VLKHIDVPTRHRIHPNFSPTTHPAQNPHPNQISYHPRPVKLLRYIAAGFINFFSITAPQPEAENRAALYIVAMLLAVLAFIAAVITFAAHILRK